ncbi:hypothetical protein ACX3O0_12505 [Homoserinimonas sp. A447]
MVDAISCGVLSNEAPPSGSGTSAEDILIEPLTSDRWRICDRRVSEHDARGLLGYIEKKNDQFEVMQLDHGFAWFYFDSLIAATDHFTRARPEAVALEDHVLSWMSAEPPTRVRSRSAARS